MAQHKLASRFERAADPVKQRIIGLSIGDPGSRKTSFWLEAPAPLVVFSFDRGLEGVVQRLQDEKDIYVKEYDWVPGRENAQDEAVVLREEFLADYAHALEYARTLVIDTETQLWELFRYAEFGSPNDNPKDYAALNQVYRKIFSDAKSTDVNLGIIERMKDKWGVNAATGRGLSKQGDRVRQGFGEADGIVHMVLTHTGVGPHDWAIEVGKIRGPGALNMAGETYGYDAVPDFATFAQLVFPDTSESDWV